MALGPSHRVEPGQEPGADEIPPPQMLKRPADVPPAVERAESLAQIQNFRRELEAQRHMRSTRRLGSTRTTARAWAGRMTGRADRRLLLAIADATEALARQHDVLVEHLTAQEAITADIACTYGEDITQLRAEVHRLRSQTTREDSEHE
jgi:hypothetical protein